LSAGGGAAAGGAPPPPPPRHALIINMMNKIKENKMRSEQRGAGQESCRTGHEQWGIKNKGNNNDHTINCYYRYYYYYHSNQVEVTRNRRKEHESKLEFGNHNLTYFKKKKKSHGSKCPTNSQNS
jgi:hypothetical protein